MRSVSRVLALAMFVALTACGGGDDPIAPVTEASVVGTWTLRQVNGDPMPFSLARTADIHVQVRSGTVAITADKRYVDAQVIRVSRTGRADTTFTQTIAGTWALVNNEMTVTVDAGGVIPILFVKNQLVKLESSFTYTYRK